LHVHLTSQSTAVVCYYPQDMGTMTMTSLNLANNLLSREGSTISVFGRQGLQKGDVVDGKTVTAIYGNGNIRVTDLSGILAVANAFKDMRAMTSLNLASNNLLAEGAKIVAEAIEVTKCTPAIILASFSCPSDFSINCCCLLLSAGYEGSICRKCDGQPHRQGTACQASGDNALQAQSCFSLRHRK
jgi:hypothetical protein